jgi:thiosulfate reductase cytochrome b subunit
MTTVPTTLLGKNKVAQEPVALPETANQGGVRLVKKHPLAIRWNHWINFPVLFIMIWSGILILWANDVYPVEKYAIRVPNRISFYSGTSAKAPKSDGDPPTGLRIPINLPLPGGGVAVVYGDQDQPDYPAPEGRRYDIRTGFRLSEGMAWHFALAWIFTLNGVAYTIFLIVSGQWRHLVPQKNSFSESFKVVLYDIGLYKKPLPPGKYNHAQRIAYSGVWVMGVGMVVTGLAMYKPAQLGWLVGLLGGYQTARTEHFLITCLFLAFFVVHIAQVIRTGWNNFRGMVTGYELERVTDGVENE